MSTSFPSLLMGTQRTDGIRATTAAALAVSASNWIEGGIGEEPERRLALKFCIAPIAPSSDQRFDASDIWYDCGEDGAFPADLSGTDFRISMCFGFAWAREAAAPATEIESGLQISTGLWELCANNAAAAPATSGCSNPALG